MVPQRGDAARADLIVAEGGAAPNVVMLDSDERLPWAGHSARYALGELYALIKAHRTTLVFVNTRSQAEGIFQDLWHRQHGQSRSALHHGSLDVAQRRKVEARWRAAAYARVVHLLARSGVDSGDRRSRRQCRRAEGRVRGCSQRIGRANHRMNEPSKGVFIPANRFEVFECRAAIDAIAVNAQDTPARAAARSTCWPSMFLAAPAVGRPGDDLFAEVTLAAPDATLAGRTSTPSSISSPPALMRSRL